MTRSARRVAVAALTVVVLGAGTGCGDSSGDATLPPPPPGPPGPWVDIDTTRPSEDPVGTVYGYVQAMAAGDADRACEFQYRGSSDFDDDSCVLVMRAGRRAAGPRCRPAGVEVGAAGGVRAHGLPAQRGRPRLGRRTPRPAGRPLADPAGDAGIWFIA